MRLGVRTAAQQVPLTGNHSEKKLTITVGKTSDWTVFLTSFTKKSGFNDATAFTLTDSDGSTAVPEPTTVLLLGAGLMGIFASRRKGRNSIIQGAGLIEGPHP